jgi:6-bladed beta-propeller
MDIPSTRLPLRCFVLGLSLGLQAAASGPMPCFAQGYPSHAVDPVIVEYDVDPAWPNHPDTVAPFGWVSGMAIDGLGQVWVFNRGKDPIQVYTAEGEFVRTWGRGDFSDPHQIRIGPEGNIWVADFGLHIVQKYTPEGELLMTLGVRGEKGSDEAHFNMPTDMAVTPDGDIFVTDGYGNRRVVHFDRDGRFIKSWGEYGSGPGQFVLPHAIVVDSDGLLYVADRNSGRIQVFDQDGTHRDTWANLIMPWGLSVTDGDEIWVCGSSPHWWVRDGYAPEYKDQMLMRFNRGGAVQQVWSLPLGDIGPDKNNPDTSHLKHGETVGVHCIVQDTAGNLYIGDIYGQRAQKLVPVTTRPAPEEQPQSVPQ